MSVYGAYFMNYVQDLSNFLIMEKKEILVVSHKYEKNGVKTETIDRLTQVYRWTETCQQTKA